ncbi:MAG: coenzyme F420-0:L-glutamate ligase, partial [Anaerolineales bacterium]|nr:coenzyme F420-0:L-glutamate ligase [Anaerolineales bacterium]
MSRQQLTFTALPDIPLVRPRDDLVAITLAGLGAAGMTLRDGDVIVVGQKIISKAEGRFVDLRQIHPSPEADTLAEETGKDPRLVELILRESVEILRKRDGLIIVEHKLGFVCANAGIDRSNVENEEGGEWVLLLPEDPEMSARELRNGLCSASGADMGVLIIDSHGRPWRMGTVGVCIGVAGFPAVVDLRGQKDLFGYTLRSTVIGLADEIAAGASALMGQADEKLPVIHVRGLPYPLREGSLSEILREKELDLFR